MDTERLLREPEVIAQTSDSRDTLLKSIKDGRWPPPVRTPGTSRNAWPLSEVQAIIRARIAGASDDDIRALVKTLVAKRSAGVQRAAA